MTRKILFQVIAAVLFLGQAAFAQVKNNPDHEKYYPLLGKTKREIQKMLPTEFGVYEATQSKTNKDSVRLVFYVNEGQSKYTLFLFGGTCTYIGVTCYNETNQQLIERLRGNTKTYGEPYSEDELSYYVIGDTSNRTERVVAFFEYIPDRLEIMISRDSEEPETASTFYISSPYLESLWRRKPKK